MKLHRNSNIKTCVTLCNGSLVDGKPIVDCVASFPEPMRLDRTFVCKLDSQNDPQEFKSLDESDALIPKLCESTGTADDSELESLEDSETKKLAPMELTEIERQWALDIKAAVEADDTLTPLSDLEYVQHAIIAKHQVSKALKRIRHQQSFKVKQGIIGYGDAETGIAITTKLFDRFPGAFMNYAKTPSGSVAQFVEVAKFYPESEYRTEEQIKEHLHALYYTYSVMQCDIEAMREGAYWVADAEGVRWKNFSFRVERRGADFCNSYPIRFKGIVVFDAPVVLTAIYNLIKPWLASKVRSCIRTTTRDHFLMEQNDFPDGVLPFSLGGRWDPEHIKEQVADLLHYRYHNLATFRL